MSVSLLDYKEVSSVVIQEVQETEILETNILNDFINQNTLDAFQITINTYLRKPMILTEDKTCKITYELFLAEENECAVVINDMQRPIGLVMKDRFFRQLGTTFGPSLFFRHSITIMMEKLPLILEIATPVQDIIDLSLNREEKFLYDCIIITENEKLMGVLSCSDLLVISRLLQKYALEKEILTVSATKQMLIQIDLSCNAVIEATKSGINISNSMSNVTSEGKLSLQKVLEFFQHYTDITLRQEAQIKELQGSTKSIKHIVQVIRGLAEQSNLLAINAAIESARAGIHGMGFAVVADEVSKLAKQTKKYAVEVEDATKQIDTSVVHTVSLVEVSRNQTENSMAYIKDTSYIFEKLFQQVSENRRSIDYIHQYAETAGHEGANALKSLDGLIEELETANKKTGNR